MNDNNLVIASYNILDEFLRDYWRIDEEPWELRKEKVSANCLLADIVCIQEASSSALQDIIGQIGYEIAAFTCQKGKNYGNAIIYNPHTISTIKETERSSFAHNSTRSVRFAVWTDFKVVDRIIRVASMHLIGYNSEELGTSGESVKEAGFQEFQHYLNRLETNSENVDAMVVGVDLNEDLTQVDTLYSRRRLLTQYGYVFPDNSKVTEPSKHRRIDEVALKSFTLRCSPANLENLQQDASDHRITGVNINVPNKFIWTFQDFQKKQKLDSIRQPINAGDAFQVLRVLEGFGEELDTFFPQVEEELCQFLFLLIDQENYVIAFDLWQLMQKVEDPELSQNVRSSMRNFLFLRSASESLMLFLGQDIQLFWEILDLEGCNINDRKNARLIQSVLEKTREFSVLRSAYKYLSKRLQSDKEKVIHILYPLMVDVITVSFSLSQYEMVFRFVEALESLEISDRETERKVKESLLLSACECFIEQEEDFVEGIFSLEETQELFFWKCFAKVAIQGDQPLLFEDLLSRLIRRYSFHREVDQLICKMLEEVIALESFWKENRWLSLVDQFLAKFLVRVSDSQKMRLHNLRLEVWSIYYVFFKDHFFLEMMHPVEWLKMFLLDVKKT